MGIEQKFCGMSNEDVAKLGQNDGCLREAVGVLCDRVKPLLTNSIYRLVGDFEVTEDVYQDTAMLIFQKFHTYDFSRPFSTWAYRVAHNCAINHLRKKKLEISCSFDESRTEGILSVEDPSLNPEELIVYKKQRDDLRRAIYFLPNRYHLVIKLLYFDELSLNQVSKILGIGEGAVRWRDHKAKKLLKKELGL